MPLKNTLQKRNGLLKEWGENMIRGTTPILEFVLPFDTELLSEAFVTLSQNREVVLDRPLSSCNCDERKLSLRLTQEETLSLECDCTTEIQVRVKTTAGESLASEIIKVDTGRILKDGVI